MFEQRPDRQEANDQTVDAERRRAKRYACDLEPFWAEWGCETGESAQARVHNISTTGLCLSTPCRVKVGSVLVINLLGECRGRTRPLSLRIIHSTCQADGHWLSGGSFVRRLSEQELEVILSASRAE